eukprot:c8901_g1_i1.p1 GENE.c8901_g1_i1~~c8901_g1_i1.p1  ORF type:complete len:223 (+),score=19.66 c8901_g1_i1:57-725(+)
MRNLVSLCQKVATSPSFRHNPQSLAPIIEYLQSKTFIDFGLSRHPFLYHQHGQVSNIRYQHIFEDRHVSIGIFLLPRHACMPLHDHPNMTVLTMCLFGAARIKSYDIADDPSSTHNGYFVDDRVLRQGQIITCHPHERNLHSIESIENFAMLDIILPPYDEERACQFYATTESPRFPYPVVLTPICDPDLNMEHEPYTGELSCRTQVGGGVDPGFQSTPPFY